jgi:PAS domain S-box-containing protein
MVAPHGKGSESGRQESRILVVDDDPHILKLLREKLELSDHTVLEASGGLEAVKCALREIPDLIILDVMMPRMDGYQVCRFVKSVPAFRNTRVLLLTVKQGVGDRQKGLLRGADDYLTKPFAMNELEEKVEALLAREPAAQMKELVSPGGQELPPPGEITDELVVSMLNSSLDESVHRFTLLEKISKSLMAAVDRKEILKTALAGVVSPVGLGWDRVLLMMVDEEAETLQAQMAFSLTERPDDGLPQWEKLMRAVRHRTMEELLDGGMKAFHFQSPESDEWLRGLRLKLDPGELSVPGDGVSSAADSLTKACGDVKLDSFLTRIFWSGEVSMVPIAGRGKIFGFLAADRFFSHGGVQIEDLDHLWFLCNQIGLAMERQLLHQEVQQRADDYERLSLLNESIMDSIDLGVVFVDGDGAVRKWNRAMARFTGVSDEAAKGRPFFDLFPSLNGTMVRERFDKTRDGNAPQRVGHYSHSFQEGKEGVYDIRLAMVRRRKQTLGTVMIWENVQLRIRLEREAQEAYRYLTNLIEHSGDAILTLNGKGRIKTWNKGAETIFGYGEDEIVGRNISRLYDEDNRGEAKKLLEKTYSDGKVTNLLETCLHKDGEPVQVSITTSIVSDADGSRKDVAAIIRDVSERMRMESQLFQTEKLASLGIMAAGMAHEINNPLTSIMMYSQILSMNKELGEEDRGCIDKIEEDAGRIADIVNSLLVFSRPSSRQEERVDVRETMEKAISFVRYQTGRKKFDIDCSCGGDLPILRGVTTEIQEVFLNLMINARDALEDGGRIQIAARFLPAGSEMPADFPGPAQGGMVEVVVRDDGEGIPKEHLKKIYDPFFTTKPPGKGTGLGLAVVRRLVENHQGCITVRSKAGEGTVFTVYLPAG